MTRATVRDVARRAGVSVATVSRVLNGTKRVAPESRDRVETAIAELRYAPSSAAQSLRRAKTQALGLVLPGLGNPFFPSLIEQAVRVAEKAGYTVTIRLSSTPMATSIEMSQGQHVDGIVVVGNQGEPEPTEELGRALVPLVAFDRLPNGTRMPLFQVANASGSKQVVEHLLSRTRGDVELLHIAGPRDLDVSRDRLQGVRAAMDESRERTGRNLDLTVLEGDFSEEVGFAATQDHLARGNRTSAVFAANDLMAIGALRAAQAAGLVVGRDVLVAGFDGLDLGAYITPGLTTYRQPIAHISQEAVTRLIELIELGAEESNDVQVRRFSGELIVRESSGREND